jgi:antitoxin HicB
MMRKFKVVLEPNELGGYTAIVPLLPGCIIEGDSSRRFCLTSKGAIELYIDGMKADGKSVHTEEKVDEAIVEIGD